MGVQFAVDRGPQNHTSAKQVRDFLQIALRFLQTASRGSELLRAAFPVSKYLNGSPGLYVAARRHVLPESSKIPGYNGGLEAFSATYRLLGSPLYGFGGVTLNAFGRGVAL